MNPDFARHQKLPEIAEALPCSVNKTQRENLPARKAAHSVREPERRVQAAADGPSGANVLPPKGSVPPSGHEINFVPQSEGTEYPNSSRA